MALSAKKTLMERQFNLDSQSCEGKDRRMKAAHKRATVYVDRQLHCALRRKAAESECSITTLVNDAVRMALLEDTEDLAAIAARRNEPDLDFEDVLRDIKRRGRL